jgi:hypothetical protein
MMPEQIAEGIRLLERAAERVAADTTARLWLGLAWLEHGFRGARLSAFGERAGPGSPGGDQQWLPGPGVCNAQGRWREGRRLARRAIELSGAVVLEQLHCDRTG